jgi:beta-1,2-mannobiose phosphorylase / 1,2-beta-oligomannan phosphorylase
MYTVRRSPKNPILVPSPERHWELVAFNPSPYVLNGKVELLYRAQGRPDKMLNPPTALSIIGRAAQTQEDHFEEREPFVVPTESWDKYGCEDPRVTFFEGRYYTFYTALGGIPFGPENIKVACAVSDDMRTITEKHLVTPFNAKAMALFPERVHGKVTVIFAAHTDDKPIRLAIAQADAITDFWKPEFWEEWHTRLDEYSIELRRNQDDFVEIGAVPLKTKEGWLLVYSYITDYLKGDSRTFGIEALLLDSENPYLLSARTNEPFLVPEMQYEGFGIVGRVAFPSGALIEGDRLDVYYGGADTVCCKASLHLPHLMQAMLTDPEEVYVKRYEGNPTLVAIPEHPWESRLAFNPTAVDIDGTAYIVYRAMGADNTSVMGLAISKNGITIDERLPEPIYTPRSTFELKHGSPTGNSGCEDPRLTRMGNTLYMTYTAYEGVGNTRVALTTISIDDFVARRFEKWSEPILITPPGIDEKDVCIFPEKIRDKYMFLHRVSPMICITESEDEHFNAETINRCLELIGPRPGSWESEKVGIAGTPMKTDKGWLLIYHAVSREKHYSLGAALLDFNDPTKVLGRTIEPILSPRRDYELVGEIPNVVFSCGHIIREDTLFIYYGGADTVTGVATCSLSWLLDILQPKSLL